jgi:hypothetical protein
VGSVSGRATLAFSNSGYSIEAIDASPKLAKLSSNLTGIKTRRMRVEELNEVSRYDGIWACISLLHRHEHILPKALRRLALALRDGGVIYMSFKYGSGERISEDGRLFTDLDEDGLSKIINSESMLHLEELWISHGEDVFKGHDTWLNAIVSKH